MNYKEKGDGEGLIVKSNYIEEIKGQFYLVFQGYYLRFFFFDKNKE